MSTNNQQPPHDYFKRPPTSTKHAVLRKCFSDRYLTEGSLTSMFSFKEITFEESETLRTESVTGNRCGDMVAIRPCAEEYENKTFLGILIGDIALSIGATLDQNDVLTIRRQRYNPAIFIPEKNAVVYGCESFWGKIESEDQLKNISDQDIENIWYVKALQQIQEGGNP